MDTEKMKQDLGGGNVFEIGDPNTAFAQYFIGQSYLKMLTTERVGVGNVTFEPGCRNNWHIHHKGGQILLVTGGRGYYQEWGKEARELHAGDVVNIPPEVKHCTAPRRTDGSSIWPLKCRQRARPTSGLKRFQMKNIINYN